MTAARRGRGRPRADTSPDTRVAIIAAARSQFAAKGFAGASLRAIAAEAGVDVSLISHHFGDKTRLLVATMELPIDPVAKIAEVMSGDPADLAARMLRTFLEAWDPHRDVFSALTRTTFGGGDLQPPMLLLARKVLVTSLRDVLTGDDRELRATLIASQLIGMAILRYVARLEPLANAPIGDVVRLYAAPIQQLVDGDPPVGW